MTRLDNKKFYAYMCVFISYVWCLLVVVLQAGSHRHEWRNNRIEHYSTLLNVRFRGFDSDRYLDIRKFVRFTAAFTYHTATHSSQNRAFQTACCSTSAFVNVYVYIWMRWVIVPILPTPRHLYKLTLLELDDCRESNEGHGLLVCPVPAQIRKAKNLRTGEIFTVNAS